MIDEGMKEVYFNQYCKSCKHFELPEHEEPCDSCLAQGANFQSHKPSNYEEAK
jgi:hypothetical protein